MNFSHWIWFKYSKKLVGYVLPLNTESLPIGKSFHSTSLGETEQMLTIASKASVYMAQALSPNTPPFCIDGSTWLQNVKKNHQNSDFFLCWLKFQVIDIHACKFKAIQLLMSMLNLTVRNHHKLWYQKIGSLANK